MAYLKGFYKEMQRSMSRSLSQLKVKMNTYTWFLKSLRRNKRKMQNTNCIFVVCISVVSRQSGGRKALFTLEASEYISL
jgi:hypothetical protein